MQRAYDQIVIDICLQKLPVCLCLDRAGLVGADGQTHQGIFDLSYLSHIPNLTILSPKDTVELDMMLKFSYTFNSPLVIRYNNGLVEDFSEHKDFDLKWEKVIDTSEAEITLLACGYRMNKLALEVAKISSRKINVVNARVVKPLDDQLLDSINTPIITLEDNIKEGGFGRLVQSYYNDLGKDVKIKVMGVNGEYIAHASVDAQLLQSGLCVDKIIEEVEKL